MTGKQIMKTASVNMKNITLETGGKLPLLVFDDADLEHAAKWTHIGIMFEYGADLHGYVESAGTRGMLR